MNHAFIVSLDKHNACKVFLFINFVKLHFVLHSGDFLVPFRELRPLHVHCTGFQEIFHHFLSQFEFIY